MRDRPATTHRIFLGLSEVAGYFSTLETGLRSLGVEARFHNLSANPLGYGRSRRAGVGRVLRLRYAPRTTWRYRAWLLAAGANRVIRRLRAALLFPWALLRYDTFIVGGHETFLGGVDLWVLRRSRKTVVIVFTGSDHRPPYLSAYGPRDHPSTASLAAETDRIRRRVSLAERCASSVVALPESAQLHRRPFIDFLAVGNPCTPPRPASPAEPRHGEATDRPIRVLHCPTDPEAKGSPTVRAAVARCRARGLAIEFRELTGRPNAEVLDALEWCDLVVDEVYSDTPMGKFATEAAFFAKPVIVGSYAAPTYATRPGDGPEPPSHYCHPDAIEDAICNLATDEGSRGMLGRRAFDFVEREWTPVAVARRFLQIIEGRVPSSWVVTPGELTYVHGWGLPEARLRTIVGSLVTEQGPEALGLPRDSPIASMLLGLVRQQQSGIDGA